MRIEQPDFGLRGDLQVLDLGKIDQFRIEIDGDSRDVRVSSFGNQLNGRYGLPVVMWDERLTTAVARTLTDLPDEQHAVAVIEDAQTSSILIAIATPARIIRVQLPELIFLICIPCE